MSIRDENLSPSRMALFLDFDGTLAPLQDDPHGVFLSEKQQNILLRCAKKLDGVLVLISGRDISDLCLRAPRSLWRLGNHGLYQAAPGTDPVVLKDKIDPRIVDEIQTQIKTMDGVWCEEKGPILCLHYRGAVAYKDRLESLAMGIASEQGLKVQMGNHIVELKPEGANKGVALGKMMDLYFPSRIPVMIGDDTTDEDGFMEAQKRGGLGIRVGRSEKTIAKLILPDIQAVYQWMERL